MSVFVLHPLLFPSRDSRLAFIKYSFSYTKFRVCKTVLGTRMSVGNCARKRADVHVQNKNIFLKIYRAHVREIPIITIRL